MQALPLGGRRVHTRVQTCLVLREQGPCGHPRDQRGRGSVQVRSGVPVRRGSLLHAPWFPLPAREAALWPNPHKSSRWSHTQPPPCVRPRPCHRPCGWSSSEGLAEPSDPVPLPHSHTQGSVYSPEGAAPRPFLWLPPSPLNRGSPRGDWAALRLPGRPVPLWPGSRCGRVPLGLEDASCGRDGSGPHRSSAGPGPGFEQKGCVCL